LPTSSVAFALRSNTTPAKIPAVMKPANAKKAPTPRRQGAGTSTAAIRQTAAAASSDSSGESVSQSTFGVSIFTG
jgi:hypothetical protein